MASAPPSTALSTSWAQHDLVLLRRKVLAIAPQFHIHDAQGGLVLYCAQKLFALKEDIRVFGDQARQHPILVIKARSIIDFSAAYDVHDAVTSEKLGVYQRRGWKSMLRDSWIISDPNDQPIGKIEESGSWLLKRLFSSLIPQKFDFVVNGRTVGQVRQKFNPFVFKAELDMRMDPDRSFDRRMTMAGALLLMAIEGRQQ
jgi:hypothetical protein